MKVRLPKSGFNKFGDIQKLAQKAQDDMAAINREIDEKIYTSTVGGGTVEVTITGLPKIQSIHISPEIVDPNDISILEETILAGVNEVLEKSAKDRESKINEVTNNFKMPGLF